MSLARLLHVDEQYERESAVLLVYVGGDGKHGGATTLAELRSQGHDALLLERVADLDIGGEVPFSATLRLVRVDEAEWEATREADERRPGDDEERERIAERHLFDDLYGEDERQPDRALSDDN